MTDGSGDQRSRRALLAAAAGGAAALAASAALPLTAMAHDVDDVALGAANATTTTTAINNSVADITAFAASAQGTGYGLQGTSAGGPGVFGWTVSAPVGFTPEDLAYTGVFGSAPTNPDPLFGAAGVWGYSDDFGVYGSGAAGVYGYGGIGVVGESASTAAGVLAIAQSATDLALDVRGKVKFSRSGRSTIGAGKSNLTVTLAGVSSASRVFAVLHTNRTGRWVQAVVPVTGKFVIYLNGTVASATYVAWFVLN